MVKLNLISIKKLDAMKFFGLFQVPLTLIGDRMRFNVIYRAKELLKVKIHYHRLNEFSISITFILNYLTYCKMQNLALFMVQVCYKLKLCHEF